MTIEAGSVVGMRGTESQTVRYREEWRWNEATKNWWLMSGMPDLWDGE